MEPVRRSTSTRDRDQWAGMAGEDRGLVLWALSSLMVAEERITTKFSGLVGAYGTEEEATFLATQQVDEARHMQFYARFQDEVVAEPAAIAAHVARAREQLSPAFRHDLRRGAGAGARAAGRRPGDAGGEGPLRHDLPPDPRGHARPDRRSTSSPATSNARRCCRASSRATRRSTTTRSATSATASGSCARPCASSPSWPRRVRETLRDAAAVRRRGADAAGPRGHRLGRARRQRGRDPRLRPRRPHAPAEHRRRAARRRL